MTTIVMIKLMGKIVTVEVENILNGLCVKALSLGGVLNKFNESVVKRHQLQLCLRFLIKETLLIFKNLSICRDIE